MARCPVPVGTSDATVRHRYDAIVAGAPAAAHAECRRRRHHGTSPRRRAHGPPLVALHGKTLSATMWLAHLDTLAASHRVVMVDTSATWVGASPRIEDAAAVEDVVAWLDAVIEGLGIERAGSSVTITARGWRRRPALRAPRRGRPARTARAGSRVRAGEAGLDQPGRCRPTWYDPRRPGTAFHGIDLHRRDRGRVGSRSDFGSRGRAARDRRTTFRATTPSKRFRPRTVRAPCPSSRCRCSWSSARRDGVRRIALRRRSPAPASRTHASSCSTMPTHSVFADQQEAVDRILAEFLA